MQKCEQKCNNSGVCDPDKKMCCTGYSCKPDGIGFACQKTEVFSRPTYSPCNTSDECKSAHCHKMSSNTFKNVLPDIKDNHIIGVCLPNHYPISLPNDF